MDYRRYPRVVTVIKATQHRNRIRRTHTREMLILFKRIALLIVIIVMSVQLTPFQLIETQLLAIRALERRLAPDGYEAWIREMFPKYVTRPLADFHYDFWDHVWPIELGQRPSPYVAPWFRGGAKSSSIEMGTVAMGARGKRRYALYVHAIQGKANDHLLSIRDMIENSGLARRYPIFANPKVGKQSNIRGWNMERLWTGGSGSEEFIIDAYGLDAGLRGAKIAEIRPDLIIFDDVDEENDSPGMVTKKIELMSKKIVAAGDLTSRAIFFMQTITHRDSVMSKVLDHSTDFLAGAYVSMGGPIPILIGEKIDRDIQDQKWVIKKGQPRWPSMTIEDCQGLLDDLGYRPFQTECLQNVNTPYEGAIFPAWDPVRHVITWTEFWNFFGPAIEQSGLRPDPNIGTRVPPVHGYKYFAQDVGTTDGHPCVTHWAWQPGEGMPLANSLFFYRETCRPRFPKHDSIEIVAPVRLGMEIQDIERGTGEKIIWRIGSHEQKITRNSYEVDLPMVPLPQEFQSNTGKLECYKAMYVAAIDTSEKGIGISTLQDYLMPDMNIPHPFACELLSNGEHDYDQPLMGRPQVYYVVPDAQGALYRAGNGALRRREAIDEAGFSRARWEYPKYRHHINASGEEMDKSKKLDDDAMDVDIAMCAKARFAIQKMSERERAIRALPKELRPDAIADNPHPMAAVSARYLVNAHMQAAKNKGQSWMKKQGLG